MKLLIVICDRTLSKKIIKILNQESICYHVSFFGKGTADSTILSYFGLEKSEKEVILSLSEKENVELALKKMSTYDFIINHGAVAFAVPLDGISKNTLDYIKKMEVSDAKH